MVNIDKKTERPVRIGLISLGCAKNLVDAEIILGTLARDGMEITNDAALADVVIVNTCSFIDAAQEESVDTILEFDQVRAVQNRGQGLIVAGCLPQRFRDELPKLLPEVDAFMGIDQVPQVTQIVWQALEHRTERLKLPPKPKARKAKVVADLAEINAKTNRSEEAKPTGQLPIVIDINAPIVNVNSRPVYIPDYATPRFRLTPRHFAYLKIAEGCNHPCSFCIIPSMRGSHRSRSQADVVRDAKQLVSEGVKELNLISQDTTYYGLDLRPNRQGPIASPGKFTEATRSLPADATTLCTLLRELNALPGEFWIRLLYTHPAHWTDDLIRTMAECAKVARYVDMPLQHIHPLMLERMRRETSAEYIIDLIAKIRAGIPGIALRTTFIVGFPGETEAHFETLLQFIETTRFERLGVFTYSAEEGTRAAKMAGPSSDKVKQQRRDRAMAAQLNVSRQIAAATVGRTLTVLVEKEADAQAMKKSARVSSWEHGLVRGIDHHQRQLQGQYGLARGMADAPDIDGRVYVRGTPPVGEFIKAKIIGHTDYDLIAEIV